MDREGDRTRQGSAVLDYVNAHTHRFGGTGIELKGVGLHPWHCEQQAVASLPWDSLYDYVGEIGLDYACTADRDAQMKAFREQLAIAEKLGKPVVLHCVRAFEPCMRVLAEYRLAAVVFHGFMGSVEQMQRAVAAGCYLSFGATTRKSPRKAEASRKAVPACRLMLETDDSSATIEEIYAYAAKVRGVDIEDLKSDIYQNYVTLARKN